MDLKNQFNDNLPYQILRLGKKCNVNCIFCNVPQESYPLKDMTLKEAKHEIDKISSASKNPKLDISGGEPSIYKNLNKIIKYASERSIKIIQLQTNGILLSDRDYTRRLKSSGLTGIFVGLHASIPAIHDKMTGRRGAFKKCIMGIKNASASGLQVILNPVVTTLNYKNMPSFINFIGNKFPQIRSISLSVVQPRGRAWIKKNTVPRYSEIENSINEALRKSKKYNIKIINPYCGVPLCIGGWKEYLTNCVEYCQNLLNKKNGTENALDKEKIKAPQCLFCDLKEYCNGVWKEYAKIYPLSDLKPILKERNGKYSLYSSHKKM